MPLCFLFYHFFSISIIYPFLFYYPLRSVPLSSYALLFIFSVLFLSVISCLSLPFFPSSYVISIVASLFPLSSSSSLFLFLPISVFRFLFVHISLPMFLFLFLFVLLSLFSLFLFLFHPLSLFLFLPICSCSSSFLFLFLFHPLPLPLCSSSILFFVPLKRSLSFILFPLPSLPMTSSLLSAPHSFTVSVFLLCTFTPFSFSFPFFTYRFLLFLPYSHFLTLFYP